MRARGPLLAGLLVPLALALGCDGCDVNAPDAGVPLVDASGTPLADAGDSGGDAGTAPDGGAPADSGGPVDDDGGGDVVDDDGGGDAVDDDGGVDAGNDDEDDGGVDAGGSVDAGHDAGEVGSDAGAAGDLPCPGAGLALRLTWTTVGDLDLHLSLDAADWCSDEDCWWANCAPDASFPLDWDGVSGASAGDPRLLVDDADGFGPEVICVEQPFVADYVIGVRYETYPGWPATDARVEVFSSGTLVGEVALDGLTPSEFWEPGRVVVSASDVSLIAAPRVCAAADEWICQDEPGACPAASP